MQAAEKVLSLEGPEFERRAQANMALMLAGKLVSTFGTLIYNFAIGLYVLQVTGSGMSFATTLLLSVLPRIIIGPFAGVIADRLPRKLMVVSMDLLSGAVVTGLFILSGFWGLHLSYIYVATVLLSLVNTLFTVTLDAATPGLVDDKRLMRINSLSHSIFSLAEIVAPAVGGMIFVLVDIRIFMIITGIAFLLSGITELFIDFHLNVKGAKSEAKSVLADLAAGLGFLRRHEFLYAICCYAVFINFFTAMGFSVALPFILNNVIGFSEAQYGLAMAIFPAGIFISSLVLSIRPEAKSKYRMLIIGALVLSLGQLALGIPALPAFLPLDIRVLLTIYIGLLLVSGVTKPIINVPIFVLMQRETPEEYRGRVFGLLQTAAISISPVGFVLAGLLIEIWPAWSIPVLSGLGMLGIVVLMKRNDVLKSI
ncbi:MAG: MFS transporter [Firmicutes bacterium]|nr:MFS transporter [Bacillota bacterium]